jgi:hypothetical protein
LEAAALVKTRAQDHPFASLTILVANSLSFKLQASQVLTMATDKEVVEKKTRPPRVRKARDEKPKPETVAPAGKGRGKGKKANPPPAKKTKAAKAAPPAKGKKGSTPKGKEAKKTVKAKKPAPEKKTPKTAEELNAEMDAYLMKDEKTALKKLDEDMETYRANAAKKKEEKKTAPVEASA